MSTVTTYLAVHDARAAIDFYQRAFGATERYRMPNDDGSIGHAELQFGDTTVMLSDEAPQFGAVSPKTLGGTCVALVLETEDLDAAWKRAIDAGATVSRPITEAAYGRGGWLIDPFGIRWSVMHSNPAFDPSQLQA